MSATDKKLQDTTDVTSWPGTASTSLVYIVDTAAGTDNNISLTNFFGEITVGVVVKTLNGIDIGDGTASDTDLITVANDVGTNKIWYDENGGSDSGGAFSFNDDIDATAGVVVKTLNGIDIGDGTASDTDLVTVKNDAGTNKMWYDEDGGLDSGGAFAFNDDVAVAGGLSATGDATVNGELKVDDNNGHATLTIDALTGWKPKLTFSENGTTKWVVRNNETGDDLEIVNAGESTVRFSMSQTGDLTLGGSGHPSANSGYVLSLSDNTNDPTPGTNMCCLYGKNNAGNVELYGRSETGAATLLAPHANLEQAKAAGIIIDEDDPFPEVNYSINHFLGYETWKYWRMDGTVQRITREIPKEKKESWGDLQETRERESIEKIEKWNLRKQQAMLSGRQFSEPKPALYKQKKNPFIPGGGLNNAPRA